MNSSTSSIIGALGAGSGVDMVKLASDLSAARFAAQTKQLESRAERLETRISAAAALKNQLSQLAAAMGERVRGGDLAPAASISDPGVATVTAQPGGRTDRRYSLEVTSLAAHQVLASKAYAAPDAKVGAGELTVQFGTVAGSSFTRDNARAPLKIAVTGDDTLTSLASKIEAGGAGLSAYVAQSSAGAQLVIKGADGAQNGFTLSTSGFSLSSGPGNLRYLNWSPSSGGEQLKARAADAAFLLDGVAMTSPSNTVESLPDGLSLTLTGTNPGAPAQIAFSSDTAGVGAVMADMVTALNEVATRLRDSANPLGGELGNDGGARAVKRALAGLPQTVVMPNAADGAPRTLGDLGLTLTREGTFQLDADRLKRTMTADPQGAAAMFTPGLFGVYATLDKLARTAGTSGDPGSLGGSVVRYQQQKERVDARLTRLQEQQDALRAQLADRFVQSDRRVSRSQNTLAFLQNQIAVWRQER